MYEPILTLLWPALVITLAQVNLSGGWRSENTPTVVTLSLQVQESVVTGMVKEGDAPSVPIFEGKVEGYLLTFTTDGLLNGIPVTLVWTGNLEDDGFTITKTIQHADGRVTRLPNVFRFHRD